MYLEISARSSGKTPRLITAAKDFTSQAEGNLALIVCHTQVAADRIAQLVGPHAIPLEGMSTNFLRGLDLRLAKFFVDDFDRIDENRLAIVSDGYYVTTPVRLRGPNEDDFFTKLMAASDQEIKRYGMGGRDVTSFYRAIGRGKARTQIHGDWLRDSLPSS